MRRPGSWSVAVVLACLAVAGAVALAQEGAKPAHVMVMPADLKWGDPPPVFEKGMSFTVVSGDPGASGIFVVRLKMPAGYKIAPHWHPTDEHVTVLQGTLGLGMGDKFDKATGKELAAGGYALLPAQMHHYAFAKTDTVVQVHGLGPFALTYINPADDPQKRTAAK
ncbi:MAG TPA: cupin domain-containing protein [Verrucomicrobiae bacterium]|nr:cupin domain-containing protein [Verrucomicrobiae bacterium]